MRTRKIKISDSLHLLRQLFLSAAILMTLPLQAEEPEMWLSKMQNAVHGLNYTGTYVYINNGQIETMKIVHAVDDAGERERLLSLNGEAREILRDSENVTCILPADKSVIIGKHKSGTGLPALVPDNISELHSLYHIEMIGRDRIAGYPTIILSIQPKDKMRFGYKIWLENESGMVLRSDIIDSTGKVMEKMMFTEIVLQTPVSESMLQATVPHEKFRIIKDDPTHSADQPVESSPWAFTRMPEGFKVKHQLRKQMPMKRSDIEHIVLSDGLATVSVYIEKSGARDENLDGPSSMGGINAYGRKINDFRITVMGEVPRATVREIAQSLSYRHN